MLDWVHNRELFTSTFEKMKHHRTNTIRFFTKTAPTHCSWRVEQHVFVELITKLKWWYDFWPPCIKLHCLTVYPKKYAHGFVVLCFVVVMQSFIMNSHEVFIYIHQGCFAGTGAIVRLPQCQWSKPDGYGKISQCIITTKHSKAKTVCIFLGIYCIRNTVFFSEYNVNLGHALIIQPKLQTELICYYTWKQNTSKVYHIYIYIKSVPFELLFWAK